MNRTRTPVLISSTLLLALAVAGCGQGADSAGKTDEKSSASSTPHGYVEGAEEKSEPQLRLTVNDGTDGGLKIVDLVSEETVSEFKGDSSTRISTADNRYVFEKDAKSDKATVIDSGVWTVDHGDHFHYYRSDPKSLGELSGKKPGHVVSNGSKVAFFFDGDGTAKVYDRQEMKDGKLRETESVNVGAHHGVAVPLKDHLITTAPTGDSDDLPGQLAHYDGSGKKAELSGKTTCTDFHGAVAVGDSAVFACDEGVVTVDNAFKAELHPYPEQASGRAFTLTSGKKLVAAPLKGGGMGIFNTSTGRWVYADTEAEILSVDVSPDDRKVVGLDADGVAHSIDPTTGDELSQRKVMDAPEGLEDKGAPKPMVTVDQERAYVSDPGHGRILEIDVADNLREARALTVGGHPAKISVTGR